MTYDEVRVKSHARRKPRVEPIESLYTRAAPIRPRPGAEAHQLRIRKEPPPRPTHEARKKRVRAAKEAVRDAKGDFKKMKKELKQIQDQCKANTGIAKGDVLSAKIILRDKRVALRNIKKGSEVEQPQRPQRPSFSQEDIEE